MYWLAMGFVWGVIRLKNNLIPPGKFDKGEADAAIWTFGQVVPVVLLAAPLLAISEYILTGK